MNFFDKMCLPYKGPNHVYIQPHTINFEQIGKSAAEETRDL